MPSREDHLPGAIHAQSVRRHAREDASIPCTRAPHGTGTIPDAFVIGLYTQVTFRARPR
jgi:hypothetical protein